MSFSYNTLYSGSRWKLSSCPLVGVQGQSAGLGFLKQVGVKYLAQGLLEHYVHTQGSNLRPRITSVTTWLYKSQTCALLNVEPMLLRGGARGGVSRCNPALEHPYGNGG